MANTKLPSSIVVLASILGVIATQIASADEPVCEREKIQQRAYKNEKSNKPADTAASFEREIAACKDKLSNRDHLSLLIAVVRTHLKDPPDLESCRRVAERGLRLVEEGGAITGNQQVVWLLWWGLQQGGVHSVLQRWREEAPRGSEERAILSRGRSTGGEMERDV
jgi:hypothetical protein